jgi:hypothetical protein
VAALDSVRDPDSWRGAFADFAQGARTHRDVRRLAWRIVDRISEAFESSKTGAQIDLDVSNEKTGRISNLIVFDGGSMMLVPLKLGKNLAYVDRVAVFLAHAGGPMLLALAFIDAIQKVLP